MSQVVEIGGSSPEADGGACKITPAMRVRGFGRHILCGDGSRNDLRSKEAYEKLNQIRIKGWWYVPKWRLTVFQSMDQSELA
jgi:hypothetical protein